MTGRVQWQRIVAEGTAIVVSILLAFGIQAWWEGKGLADERTQHLSLLREQMIENRMIVDRSATRARGAVEELERFLSIASWAQPTGPAATVPEFFTPELGMDDRDLEVSGVESVLASGYLDLAEDAALHRMLLDFRAQAGRYSRDTDRFVDVRTRVLDHLYTLGTLEQGVFRAMPAAIFSDAQLNGLVREMMGRHLLRAGRSSSLVELIDEIVASIPSEDS